LEKIGSPLETGRAFARAITAGLPELGLRIEARQIEWLADYLRLLVKWNHVYNLSGIRDPSAMVALHVFDSLSVTSYLHGSRVLDVGSGAGLPGIPLAIARPEAQFILLDSNSKKTRFLQQAVIALRLGNVLVEHSRIENYRPQVGFDTVISRAFANLADFIERAAHACGPAGRMLAMKATLSDAEQLSIRRWRARVRVFDLKVPGIERERRLVEISRT
jgi:16S rRNA (guanine527-N7)-methyltransferase